MDQIEEFLDLAPIGLEVYGHIGGQPIYSNEKIINSVIGWLNKSNITKPITKSILEGIEKRTILIGYENRGKLSFLLRKWRQIKDTSSGTYVLGYFSSKDRKLVIMLDDNVSILGKALVEIPPVITHELCHFAAFNDIRSFVHMTANKFLLPFYNNLFEVMAPKVAHMDDRYLLKTILNLGIQNEENPLAYDMKNAVNIWRSYISQEYDTKETDQIILRMGLPLKLLLAGKLKNSGNMGIAKQSYATHCKAYSKMGQNVCKWSHVGQEFSYPSEIVSVLSQWQLSGLVAKLINNINHSRFV